MIDIVIVNWNSGIQLRQCIDSILAHSTNKISRIIVVDNGSIDCSADSIEGLSKVELIRTGENLGFGAACNIGAKAGDAPYILFLNPDTIIESNSISIPLNFMEQNHNSKVGVCGIQLINEQGTISRSCAYFPTFGRLIFSTLGIDKMPLFKSYGIHMNDWDHNTSRQVDHVMGAFYLIRRKLFQYIDGFDERFFVYLEDLDLSKTVQLAGFDSWYIADTQAFHVGGGASQQVKVKRLFYSIRSRILYAFKHFPRWQAFTLVIVVFLVEPFTRTIWCLIKGDINGIRYTWSAFRMLASSMSNIISGDGRSNS